jgi:cellulose synthase (UDP-forming)
LFLAIGLPVTIFAIFGPQSTTSRISAAIIGAVLAWRYATWRFFWSMPADQGLAGNIWAMAFLVLELVTVLSATILLFFMTRTRDRTADVDARRDSKLLTAPVDVFIATYNESYEILERTVVGAKSINHPDVRVWLLDDGARDWVRDLAIELNVEYRCRVKGRHAKAGNVNNGLLHALNTGRRPKFILLLDADFVAWRNILARTLPLFEEADVGIVQTPQHFFNADPLQSNLLCTQTWPDEQRFFFNALLPCKDAWGAAFCCGTSAVFRVAALEASDGLATETVTEDMLTSFKMGEYGWRTIFLNEQLSLGLAPEGLQQYVSQRARWCLGAIQQIYTRWSFAGVGRLNFVNRISSFDGVLYWACVFPYKLMMFSAPAVFWWTGLSVVNATPADMLVWLMPYAAFNSIAMVALGRGLAIPILTDVSQLVVATTITRQVGLALLKPFGHPFKVTAKGLSIDKKTVQWGLMTPLLMIACLTAGGVLINLSPASPFAGTGAYAINLIWSVFNVFVLLVSAMVCVELPQRRTDERFLTTEPACMILADGTRVLCTLRDISLRGARVARSDGWEHPPSGGVLLLDDGALHVRFQLVRKVDDDLAISFPSDTKTRRSLIVKLFTGGYANEVVKIKIGRVLQSIVGRLFA